MEGLLSTGPTPSSFSLLKFVFIKPTLLIQIKTAQNQTSLVYIHQHTAYQCSVVCDYIPILKFQQASGYCTSSQLDHNSHRLETLQHVTVTVPFTVVETVTDTVFPVSSQNGNSLAELGVKIINSIKTLLSKELNPANSY